MMKITLENYRNREELIAIYDEFLPINPKDADFDREFNDGKVDAYLKAVEEKDFDTMFSFFHSLLGRGFIDWKMMKLIEKDLTEK